MNNSKFGKGSSKIGVNKIRKSKNKKNFIGYRKVSKCFYTSVFIIEIKPPNSSMRNEIADSGNIFPSGKMGKS